MEPSPSPGSMPYASAAGCDPSPGQARRMERPLRPSPCEGETGSPPALRSPSASVPECADCSRLLPPLECVSNAFVCDEFGLPFLISSEGLPGEPSVSSFCQSVGNPPSMSSSHGDDALRDTGDTSPSSEAITSIFQHSERYSADSRLKAEGGYPALPFSSLRDFDAPVYPHASDFVGRGENGSPGAQLPRALSSQTLPGKVDALGSANSASEILVSGAPVRATLGTPGSGRGGSHQESGSSTGSDAEEFLNFLAGTGVKAPCRSPLGSPSPLSATPATRRTATLWQPFTDQSTRATSLTRTGGTPSFPSAYTKAPVIIPSSESPVNEEVVPTTSAPLQQKPASGDCASGDLTHREKSSEGVEEFARANEGELWHRFSPHGGCSSPFEGIVHRAQTGTEAAVPSVPPSCQSVESMLEGPAVHVSASTCRGSKSRECFEAGDTDAFLEGVEKGDEGRHGSISYRKSSRDRRQSLCSDAVAVRGGKQLPGVTDALECGWADGSKGRRSRGGSNLSRRGSSCRWSDCDGRRRGSATSEKAAASSGVSAPSSLECPGESRQAWDGGHASSGSLDEDITSFVTALHEFVATANVRLGSSHRRWSCESSGSSREEEPVSIPVSSGESSRCISPRLADPRECSPISHCLPPSMEHAAGAASACTTPRRAGHGGPATEEEAAALPSFPLASRVTASRGTSLDFSSDRAGGLCSEGIGVAGKVCFNRQSSVVSFKLNEEDRSARFRLSSQLEDGGLSSSCQLESVLSRIIRRSCSADALKVAGTAGFSSLLSGAGAQRIKSPPKRKEAATTAARERDVGCSGLAGNGTQEDVLSRLGTACSTTVGQKPCPGQRIRVDRSTSMNTFACGLSFARTNTGGFSSPLQTASVFGRGSTFGSGESFGLNLVGGGGAGSRDVQFECCIMEGNCEAAMDRKSCSRRGSALSVQATNIPASQRELRLIGQFYDYRCRHSLVWEHVPESSASSASRSVSNAAKESTFADVEERRASGLLQLQRQLDDLRQRLNQFYLVRTDLTSVCDESGSLVCCYVRGDIDQKGPPKSGKAMNAVEARGATESEAEEGTESKSIEEKEPLCFEQLMLLSVKRTSQRAHVTGGGDSASHRRKTTARIQAEVFVVYPRGRKNQSRLRSRTATGKGPDQELGWFPFPVEPEERKEMLQALLHSPWAVQSAGKAHECGSCHRLSLPVTDSSNRGVPRGRSRRSTGCSTVGPPQRLLTVPSQSRCSSRSSARSRTSSPGQRRASGGPWCSAVKPLCEPSPDTEAAGLQTHFDEEKIPVATGSGLKEAHIAGRIAVMASKGDGQGTAAFAMEARVCKTGEEINTHISSAGAVTGGVEPPCFPESSGEEARSTGAATAEPSRSEASVSTGGLSSTIHVQADAEAKKSDLAAVQRGACVSATPPKPSDPSSASQPRRDPRCTNDPPNAAIGTTIGETSEVFPSADSASGSHGGFTTNTDTLDCTSVTREGEGQSKSLQNAPTKRGELVGQVRRQTSVFSSCVVPDFLCQNPPPGFGVETQDDRTVVVATASGWQERHAHGETGSKLDPETAKDGVIHHCRLPCREHTLRWSEPPQQDCTNPSQQVEATISVRGQSAAKEPGPPGPSVSAGPLPVDLMTALVQQLSLHGHPTGDRNRLAHTLPRSLASSLCSAGRAPARQTPASVAHIDRGGSRGDASAAIEAAAATLLQNRAACSGVVSASIAASGKGAASRGSFFESTSIGPGAGGATDDIFHFKEHCTVFISWIPRVARADDHRQKELMEKRLKFLLEVGLKVRGIQRVALFPPRGSHCCLIFETPQAAASFIRQYGGSTYTTTTERFKAEICAAHDVAFDRGIERVFIRIEEFKPQMLQSTSQLHHNGGSPVASSLQSFRHHAMPSGSHALQQHIPDRRQHTPQRQAPPGMDGRSPAVCGDVSQPRAQATVPMQLAQRLEKHRQQQLLLLQQLRQQRLASSEASPPSSCPGVRGPGGTIDSHETMFLHAESAGGRVLLEQQLPGATNWHAPRSGKTELPQHQCQQPSMVSRALEDVAPPWNSGSEPSGSRTALSHEGIRDSPGAELSGSVSGRTVVPPFPTYNREQRLEACRAQLLSHFSPEEQELKKIWRALAGREEQQVALCSTPSINTAVSPARHPPKQPQLQSEGGGTESCCRETHTHYSRGTASISAKHRSDQWRGEREHQPTQHQSRGASSKQEQAQTGDSGFPSERSKRFGGSGGFQQHYKHQQAFGRHNCFPVQPQKVQEEFHRQQLLGQEDQRRQRLLLQHLQVVERLQQQQVAGSRQGEHAVPHPYDQSSPGCSTSQDQHRGGRQGSSRPR
ncbi:hypothetical protein CSUI_003183 [Cystoisospora suis]|uniref:Uncharacterized protein n=1 Tax=Cystoisospora suis TaxID=483139 RepID=A0A2C6L5V7_9APIC|nr:hypothetical protein CSUI_003183 [Cystoisospora suis]